MSSRQAKEGRGACWRETARRVCVCPDSNGRQYCREQRARDRCALSDDKKIAGGLNMGRTNGDLGPDL